MAQAKPILQTVFRLKCPRCGIGDIFVNKNIFPLSGCFKTNEVCKECGQKIKSVTDSAPSINYALSVVVYIIGFILYAALWGITYKDNSIYYSLLFSTTLVVVVQPWLIRFSKAIYMQLYIRFYHD